MSLAEYGAPLLETRSVYFNGTYALRPGQPLFYLNDAASGVHVADALDTSGNLYAKTTRIGEVVDGYNGGVGVSTTTVVSTTLATGALLTQFAGIVSDAHVGLTGPRWIDIVVPQKGNVLLIEIDNGAAITKNTSLLVVNGTGSSNAVAYEPKATPVVADSSVFLALQSVSTNPNTPNTNDLRTNIWALCVR